MATYINGTIVSVSQATPSRDGSCYFQEVLMQHEWNSNNPDFNKYITFSIISTRDNKRISGFHLIPGDEVEVALDINARASESGRYFNSITCFNVERDKSKWHRYERPKRQAVTPAAFAQAAAAWSQGQPAAAAAPQPYQPAAAPQPYQPAAAAPAPTAAPAQAPAQPAVSVGFPDGAAQAQEPDDLPF